MTTTLDQVSFLASDTTRARAYLALVLAAGYRPMSAVIVNGIAQPPGAAAAAPSPRFDNVTPLAEALDHAGVPFHAVTAADLNAPEVCDAVSRRTGEIVVFAGPAGSIVRAPLFATGRSFVHVHPGRLPAFRGSTPTYYSLLVETRLTATALLLTPEIDVGPVLDSMAFDPPPDRRELDGGFDAWMRAVVLVRVLDRVARGQALVGRMQTGIEPALHVIHPVLKHLAMLAERPGFIGPVVHGN